jgi:uncharacterized protein YegJ (DUF2314 family)
MRATAVRAVILALVLIAGCTHRHANVKAADNAGYIHVDEHDPAMDKAIADAKATVADFVRAFHAKKAGISHFAVKKPFRTPDGGEEHMWIEVATERDGVLTGTVSNDAEETKEVTAGQSVTLRLSEISDWQYLVGKRLTGGYTTRYLCSKMTPDERTKMLDEAGIEL